MSNSPLVQYTRLSPNCNSPRNNQIRKITIHHVAGVCSVETLGNIFAPVARQASSNYGIGSDGRIALYVNESDRAWTSSSPENDHQAITIEVSNSAVGGNWPVSNYVLSRLIDLCVDICQRNGIERLNFTGNASGNLTAHRYFADTSCPGDYLYSKFPYIADEVNKRLTPIPFKENTIIYPIQDVKMKSTAGYENSVYWTLLKGTKCVVAKYHSINGLYMALKDEKGNYFECTWTNQFNLFTTKEPPKEDEEDMAEKDKEIAELKAQLNEQDKVLQEKDLLLIEKDKSINELNDKIATLEKDAVFIYEKKIEDDGKYAIDLYREETIMIKK